MRPAMPTRIICTVTNDLSHDQRMHRICSSLYRAGFEVWLVGRHRPNSPPIVSLPFYTRRLPCHFQRGKLFYLEYNLRLLLFLLRHRADAINSVDLDTLLPGVIAARLRRIPCIYDAHEYFTETPEVVNRPLIKFVWEQLARWCIPQVRAAYTVGPALAELLSKRYGKSFRVVRNVPHRRLPSTPREPSEPHILLYQGMLNAARGLETAIDALALLPETFHLWLVGDGDIKADLEDRVRQLGITDRVRFWGFQSPSRLPEINQAAWLGLNLLEARGLSYYYSLANKTFDYIQDRLPSVQMEFPEYSRLQAEYACFLMLAELDSETFTQALLELKSAPDQYQELLDKTAKAAEMLNWEREERRLLEIYSTIVRITL